jgi:glutamate-1-semialdehyde 2,1-aminomutase
VADHPNGSRFAIKTLFLAEMLRRGVLISASHNICYAHSDADMAHVLGAYDEVLPLVASALAEPDLDRRLDYAPIQPVFAVRGS